MSLPALEISSAEYVALPVITAFPDTSALPIGYKCKDQAGRIYELVNLDDMPADQAPLLGARSKMFRRCRPVIKDPSLLDAAIRVQAAKEALRIAEEEYARLKKQPATQVYTTP